MRTVTGFVKLGRVIGEQHSKRYSFNTPAECREYLNDWWRYGTKSQKGWRIRFAWWPVPILPKPESVFIPEPIGHRWLRNVVEVYTGLGRWVAYEDHQIALD